MSGEGTEGYPEKGAHITGVAFTRTSLYRAIVVAGRPMTRRNDPAGGASIPTIDQR